MTTGRTYWMIAKRGIKAGDTLSTMPDGSLRLHRRRLIDRVLDWIAR